MKAALVVVGGFVSLIVMVVVIGVMSYVKYYNKGNEYDNVIKASYTNMENVLGQYSLKIGEMAQIPTMQKDDLRELFSSANASRYGKDGSGAAMQWIKEQNPNLDQSTYLKIQQAIEAGRNKFENEQKIFIDKKRAYETELGYLWSGFWYGVAGYPKINLAEYKIISSDHAKEAFETGIDNGVKLR